VLVPYGVWYKNVLRAPGAKTIRLVTVPVRLSTALDGVKVMVVSVPAIPVSSLSG